MKAKAISVCHPFEEVYVTFRSPGISAGCLTLPITLGTQGLALQLGNRPFLARGVSPLSLTDGLFCTKPPFIALDFSHIIDSG